MKNRAMDKLKKYRRFIILVGTSVLSLFLVSIFLVWNAHAATQILTQGASSSKPKMVSLDTINIEFYYNGDDPVSASVAAIAFASLLSQETGLVVQASIQDCEARIVEHLGTGDADLAPLSQVVYVHGHDAHNIDARLVNGRFGQFYFRGQINVPAASGYTDIWDLQNTQFAAPVPSSVSGYMAPYLLISETTGMTPTTFFSEVDFVGSHDQVIRDVYYNTADCGASYEDARAALVGELPNVYDVVEVLTYTESVPQSPWAFRSGLDETVVQTLSDGIIAVAGTPVGESALETIFEYDLTGIGVTQDSAYDIWRDLVATFGLRMEGCFEIFLPIILKNLGQ